MFCDPGVGPFPGVMQSPSGVPKPLSGGFLETFREPDLHVSLSEVSKRGSQTEQVGERKSLLCQRLSRVFRTLSPKGGHKVLDNNFCCIFRTH